MDLATKIAERANAYEKTHQRYPKNNVWVDVLLPMAGDQYDEPATNRVDPAYMSDVMVLRDGSRVCFLGNEQRWVAIPN